MPLDSPAPASLERDLLRRMLRIRRFAERCADLLPPYAGGEAVAVGVCQALTPDDAIVCTHHEYGPALARGVPVREIAATLRHAARVPLGHDGLPHVSDAGRRFHGGGLPVAVGLAIADQLLDRRRVTACFFGDCAPADAEWLALAAQWRLPMLFVRESDDPRRPSPARGVRPGLVPWPGGLTARTVDGVDVWAVISAAEQECASLRAGSGPRFLDLRTAPASPAFAPGPDGGDPLARIAPAPADLAALEREIAQELDEALTSGQGPQAGPLASVRA
ncbi:thiamine pyrophosphate-dependent enzyme [Nonomuraea cavernae]|nr:thiamine pyrophosphate-dependent enzyme [Nonomuraea cavernae]